MSECLILAVDLGLRCGLALMDDSGRILRVHHTNFGTRSRLKSAVRGILRQWGPITHVIAEGDPSLGKYWRREAERTNAEYATVAPETWREDLLLSRDRRSGADAKAAAIVEATRILDESGLRPSTRLRDDTAEAILIATWYQRKLMHSHSGPR